MISALKIIFLAFTLGILLALAPAHQAWQEKYKVLWGIWVGEYHKQLDKFF